MNRHGRRLLVTADDFGIGPETTRGILELAQRGVVTSTVMLVNSPYAAQAVKQWKESKSHLEIGWHPCLTMDRPVLPADQVPTLVNGEGKFHSLGRFLLRLMLGKIHESELQAELGAQYHRYLDLMGSVPLNINGHHHIHIFSPVRRALLHVLQNQHPKPYLRCVQEPWQTRWSIPGIRLKRWLLSQVGRRSARQQQSQGFMGADWLIGITDPPLVKSPDFFHRWLQSAPGDVVELMCHPGHDDVTLLGRDATPQNGQRERRVHEWYLLQSPRFREVLTEQGFTLARATDLLPAAAEMRQAA